MAARVNTVKRTEMSDTTHTTTTRRPKPIPHGTPNGYVNRGCRCSPCRRAWADYIGARRRTERQRARSLAS